MSRSSIILFTVLAVVILGGGAFLWLNKGLWMKPASTTNTTNTATVTNSSVNRLTANLNLSTPDTLKGDKSLDNTLVVASTSVHVSSSLKTATYEGAPAPAGKEFVIVYFDPITADKVEAVDQALEANIHLVFGQETIALTGVKIAANLVKNDRGYLKFIVPTNAAHLILEFGTGSSAQRVALAY